MYLKRKFPSCHVDGCITLLTLQDVLNIEKWYMFIKMIAIVDTEDSESAIRISVRHTEVNSGESIP